MKELSELRNGDSLTVLAAEVVELRDANGAHTSYEAVGAQPGHEKILRRRIADSSGEELSAFGDGYSVRFEDASQAVACAIAIQLDASKLDLPNVSFRMAVHSAEAIIHSKKASRIEN